MLSLFESKGAQNKICNEKLGYCNLVLLQLELRIIGTENHCM